MTAPNSAAQYREKPSKEARGSAPSAEKGSDSRLGEQLSDSLLAGLIPGLILLHLVVAPYTKVEESFNIQAAHDVLVYGTPTSDVYQRLSRTYDHFTFPGAVPRTFVGPVLLAGLAQPIIALVGFQHAQFVVRAILGLFNAACLLVFAQNLRRAYGAGTARWYLLLQASQFHVIFYASRTLPNMFAFGLTTLAFAFLLPHPTNPKLTVYRQRISIALLVFAATIFRAEVALLLATTVLHQLLIPALALERVLFPFAVSFLTALAVSVPIDTYFWQAPRPLWPELSAFLFNVVRGGASGWGVSPWHWYATSALPRLLLNPLAYAVLLPRALADPALRRAASRLAAPAAAFVALYSAQPHKETRFVLYAVPPLTAAAALAASALFRRRRKSPLAALVAAGLVASVLASFAASTAMLAVSALNYPGGEALAFLRRSVAESAGPPDDTAAPAVVSVHADVLACMTGVTLFGTNADAPTPAAAAAAAAAVPPISGASSGGGVGSSGGAAEPVMVHHRVGTTTTTGDRSRVRLVVDKTEDAAVLSSADFWARFDFLLVEDPRKVLGGPWETVGVVKGYGGIEVVRPGTKEKEEEAKEERGDGIERKTPRVVGLGETVALWKRRVRDLTGGWWVGPKMVDRIYILRRLKDRDAPRTRIAVDAK
ncbi:glycosyltransferase family 22 protein [Thermothelomyces heterothallicus CBS 202.75]|uniref:glycosyltransferase family 22 protein n=1 Tax=Thermothelomyces heterothallicus CBS 202.75 TaxID=1149848 RepID=UPI003742D65D